MNLKSCFLTLSMKEQLCITIISLNIFCIIVIISICGSLAYEFLKEDYRQKKLYFFEKYQDYIETCFFFQNFYLLQYEELIKRIQKQIWEYQQSSSIYKFNSNFMEKEKENILHNFDTEHYYSNNQIYNNTNDFPIFYTCFYDSPIECSTMENILLKDYDSISSSIFSPYDRNIFVIPSLGKDIMSSPIFFNVNTYTMYSFDYLKMIKRIVDICGNKFDLGKIFRYYDDIVNKTKYSINVYLSLFFKNKPALLEHMFEKILKEINETFYPYINLNSYLDVSMTFSGYFPNMDYPNDKFYFISNIEEYYYYYYIESNTINNYLYYINNKISSFIDMYFIPTYFENNTIISSDLCTLFLLKQINFQKEENDLNEIINNIIKGKSKIDECLINDKINDNIGINDILFNLNISSFLFLNKNNINHGILYLKDSEYYFLKYSYPNYNTLKDFNSDYFILDQNNYYLFASFSEPINYADFCFQISLKCFYIIILVIVYVWALCLIINICIFNKVIVQLTEPIKKLQDAVESSSITDENIFRYEYDEIINELFLTCKELLSGEIGKNKNSIGNFNIISNNQVIDKNKYTKNLIINNEIINKLISEQQSMMDFSKNIEVNDFNSYDFNEKPDNNKKNINNKNNLELNIDINDVKESLKEKEKKKETKSNEINREPYEKLFKFGEYLFYYKNKTKEKYIKISEDKDKDSTHSNFSKLDNYHRKKSIKYMSKFDSGKIGEENENISINMIDKKDMRYLWYMEAKKKNNISLNYNIGKNLDELFSE